MRVARRHIEWRRADLRQSSAEQALEVVVSRGTTCLPPSGSLRRRERCFKRLLSSRRICPELSSFSLSVGLRKQSKPLLREEGLASLPSSLPGPSTRLCFHMESFSSFTAGTGTESVVVPFTPFFGVEQVEVKGDLLPFSLDSSPWPLTPFVTLQLLLLRSLPRWLVPRASLLCSSRPATLLSSSPSQPWSVPPSIS